MLTIAIICKNEEKNIKRCLDSVFACVKNIYLHEVLLIDSFSTDRTIMIAEKYPLKIIRLHKDWPHSPAAGRYMAFRHAKGRFTLCIDADMELQNGFIETAIHFLKSKPKAAAVTGILENLVGDNKYKHLIVRQPNTKSILAQKFPVDYEGWLDSIPGAGLYRTAAVRKVGNFHPYLRAEEEFELCQRLRLAGYQLWYVPQMIAKHYGYENSIFKEIWRRQKNGFMAGLGDMFKWSCITGFFWINFRRFFQHLFIGAYVGLLPAIAIIGIFKAIYLIIWIFGILLLVMVFTVRKKNLTKGLAALLNKTLIGMNIWLRLPKRINRPESYPLDVIIIDPLIRKVPKDAI